MPEIDLRTPEKVIVHDVLEYTFEDLLLEFVAEEEAGRLSSEGVGMGPITLRKLVWADGVVIWDTPYTNVYSEFPGDEARGIKHVASVVFALKPKFEKRVIRGQVTVNFLDQTEIPTYSEMAYQLKGWSKWMETYHAEQDFIKSIERKLRRKLIADEKEFITIGHKVGLSSRQIHLQLKEARKNRK